MRINHDEYYRDRLTERDLCYDFPGDEILIDGLHALQTHFWMHNVPVDIPVVRVMNTAHYLAAYMFATTCSGDQTEYDVLAYASIGHDKKLMVVAMIVLAAMLARTEGFRARQCRNLILDNRDPDFDEGVTLYDRFLRSAEKRFAEEDFLIDTQMQIQKLTAENERLIEENYKLHHRYQVMEEKYQQNIQYNQDHNQGSIYNAPVYQYFYPQSVSSVNPVSDAECSSSSSSDESTDIPDSIIFTDKTKKEAKKQIILQALQNSVNGRKDKTRAFVRELQKWQKEGYVDAHYNAKVMYDELAKLLPISFGYDVFKRHYNNSRK